MGIGWYPRRTETAVVEVEVVVVAGSSREDSTEAVQRVRATRRRTRGRGGPPSTIAIGERVIDRGFS